MRVITPVLLVLGLALYARCEATGESSREEDAISILECMFEDSVGSCFKTRLARNLDQIELDVIGKKSEQPISVVIEQAGSVIADIVDDLQKADAEEIIEEDEAQNDNAEEARKKKFSKKHKKHLAKLLALAMLVKSKISLLLQLISTHFQLKFFVIAIISLILNAVRFWIEVKKSHPSKVIYYEHAQHQHHYDHDDHDHYWGRSSNETPHELAYRAYVPAE